MPGNRLTITTDAPCARFPNPIRDRLRMSATARPKLDYPHRHLLGIEGLSPFEMAHLLDLADEVVDLNRQVRKERRTLAGRTQINLFFENSTRTQASFEIAGKRLGADVMNM